AMYVHEGEGFRLVGERGPNVGKHWSERYSASTMPAPIRTRVVDHQGTLVLTDAIASPAWPPLAAELRNSSLVRSFAALPIVSHDRLVGVALFASSRLATPIVVGGDLAGVIAFTDKPTREWSVEDVRLVEAVARELRVAMEAARISQARERENERLRALQQASAVIATRSTTREVIDEVLKTAAGLLG